MPGGSVYIKRTNTNKMNKTQTTEQTNTQHLKPITQNLHVGKKQQILVPSEQRFNFCSRTILRPRKRVRWINPPTPALHLLTPICPLPPLV
jgi:hypothetical protein